MPVVADTDTVTTLPLGGVWDLSVVVHDADGDRVAAVPTVTVTLPGGSAVTPTPVANGDGYRLLYEVGSPGRYVARVVAAGYGAVDFAAWVTQVVAGTGMPGLLDLRGDPDADPPTFGYLGRTSQTDEDIEDALTAEAAAQRARCRVGADYPDDLREALMRRVARNLALRSLPLAVLRGDADGGDNTILPGNDPEVRRLEAPHRKRPLG